MATSCSAAPLSAAATPQARTDARRELLEKAETAAVLDYLEERRSF